MRPDLVAPARGDGHVEDGRGLVPLQHLVARDRGLAVESHRDAPRAALLEGLVDLAALLRHLPFGYHEVMLLHLAGLEQPRIVAVRGLVAREHDQAAGVAVQAVNDEDPAIALVQQPYEVLGLGQVAARRHGQQAGGLVHHHQVGGLSYYLQVQWVHAA